MSRLYGLSLSKVVLAFSCSLVIECKLLECIAAFPPNGLDLPQERSGNYYNHDC